MNQEETQNKIQRAISLAQEVLGDATRKSGETHVQHSIDVYETLLNQGIEDENLLISALLHEVLHTEPERESQIQQEYGEEVIKILNGYKKLKNTTIQLTDEKDKNANFIVQTFVNLAYDMRVLVLRIADKTVNSHTLFILDKEDRPNSSLKYINLYSPIAKMLGLSKFSKIMENNAFKVLHPEEYKKASTILESLEAEVSKYMEKTLPVLESLLSEQNIKPEISYRVKDPFGVYRKALYYKSNGLEVGDSYEGIFDKVGMRILVDKVEECYLVDEIVRDLWNHLPEERDDYIQKPRKSGYKSIHNVIHTKAGFHAEVQIRTHEMHEFNEYGPASHIVYKLTDKGKEGTSLAKRIGEIMEQNPYWIKELDYSNIHPQANSARADSAQANSDNINSENVVDAINVEKNSKEIQDSIQDDIKTRNLDYFSKNIYVFTPKGDIIELPRGATALDFAFAIHADIGIKCTGAFVNGKNCKLSTVLLDGDTVQIQTQKTKQNVNRDWLKLVTTKKARQYINKIINKSVEVKK